VGPCCGFTIIAIVINYVQHNFAGGRKIYGPDVSYILITIKTGYAKFLRRPQTLGDPASVFAPPGTISLKGLVPTILIRCQRKFLTSRHVRMPVLFRIRIFGIGSCRIIIIFWNRSQIGCQFCSSRIRFIPNCLKTCYIFNCILLFF